MSDFTARMAQEQLARLDNEALTAKLADVSIALALRRDVSPHQVLRDALAAFGWPESEWPKVREHVASWSPEIARRASGRAADTNTSGRNHAAA